MDTKLFSDHQSGGMFAVKDISECPGSVFYVGSAVTSATDDAGYGRNPGAPFATLDYAISLCTASACDVIYVLPGHTETVATAAALDFDVAGIKVVGLGWGDLRPKVSLTANLSTAEFNADDMWIENIIFEGAFATGVAVGLDIKTGCDDLYFKNCVIRAGAVTTELLKGVSIEATNNRITFDGCTFFEFATGDATAAIHTEGAFTNLRIINCEFRGDWSVAVLDMDAAAVTAEGLYVANTKCFNLDASAGLFCTLDDTTVAVFIGVDYTGGKSNTPPIPTDDDGASYTSRCFGTETASTYSVVWPFTATNYGA